MSAAEAVSAYIDATLVERDYGNYFAGVATPDVSQLLRLRRLVDAALDEAAGFDSDEESDEDNDHESGHG